MNIPHTSITIDRDLLERLEAECEQQRRSRSNLINYIVRQHYVRADAAQSSGKLLPGLEREKRRK